MKTYSFLLASIVIILSSCTKKETTHSSENIELFAQVSSIPENNPLEKTFYVTASSGLSLRSGTNLKSKRILTIPYGSKITHLSSPEFTQMEIAGMAGSMFEVDYQGARGFVFSGYLSKLSPPISNETLEDYTKRISTKKNPINLIKKKSPQGDAYGSSLEMILPATSWEEAYAITKKLFELPSSIDINLKNSKTSFIVNSKKREKTLKDEVAIQRNENNDIKSIIYSYQLRDYSRDVSITKDNGGFLIKEIETSK